MGNSGRKLSLTGAAAGGEIVQPGRPKVKLGSRGPATQTEVSDEVVLTWKPCSRRDKGKKAAPLILLTRLSPAVCTLAFKSLKIMNALKMTLQCQWHSLYLYFEDFYIFQSIYRL